MLRDGAEKSCIQFFLFAFKTYVRFFFSKKNMSKLRKWMKPRTVCIQPLCSGGALLTIARNTMNHFMPEMTVI